MHDDVFVALRPIGASREHAEGGFLLQFFFAAQKVDRACLPQWTHPLWLAQLVLSSFQTSLAGSARGADPIPIPDVLLLLGSSAGGGPPPFF